MKKIWMMILAGSLVLSAFSQDGAMSSAEKEQAMKLDQLMQGFYRNPAPEKVDSLLSLMRNVKAQTLNQNKSIYATFLGEIFAQHPQFLARWSNAGDNEALREILHCALLYANTPEARNAYMSLTGTVKENYPQPPPNVSTIPAELRTPEVLDACWGGFFASGKKSYVKQIIDAALAISAPESIDITQQAALWSLQSVGETHPSVKEYFEKQARNSSSEVQYALAKQISEARQKELLGIVLISDEEKDQNDSEEQKHKRKDEAREATRLKGDFFDFTKTSVLRYQSDYLADAQKLVAAEIKRRLPDLTPEQVEQSSMNMLNLDDSGLYRKLPDEAGFIEFLAIQKYLRDNPYTKRQQQLLLQYALKLAAKHPDSLITAQLIFRGLLASNAISNLTPPMLEKYKIHPYLALLLQGEQARITAWKHRGGGYSNTVPTHGWQAFRENLTKARPFFEQASQQYPQAPEAPTQMIHIVATNGNDNDNIAIWLRRALIAQADYSDAISTYAWFNRPRWGGSPAQLRADARAFFALSGSNPRLAQNGLILFQAFLSEIPVIDNIRYFVGLRNYEEIKSLFNDLARIQPLNSSQKIFLGTAALLADDQETAEEIAESLTAEDLKFAETLLYGSAPQLFWFDFPTLHKTLKRTEKRQELWTSLTRQSAEEWNTALKSAISQTKDKEDRQVLIDLYAMLNGKLDWMYFRGRMPVFIRLCHKPAENMELIREMIAMGTDLEVVASFGKPLRPLFYAMSDKKSGELLEILLKAGANPNTAWGEYYPLDYSIHSRLPAERIRRVLEAGADPNQKYKKTFTPLHAAINYLEGTKLLVEFGANLNEVSEFGQTPLDLAEKAGSADVVAFLRSKGAKHAAELK